MVIDTSALVAILLNEPEAGPFAKAIASDSKRLISAFNLLETAIVIETKKGEAGGRELDLLLHRAQIEAVSLTSDQSEMARTAWRRYGKGKHPAGLNIGDCCAYALAQYSGEPLLFKGDDFNQTDVPLAQIDEDWKNPTPGPMAGIFLRNTRGAATLTSEKNAIGNRRTRS